MPALDNIFMTAIAVIGAPLAIGSFIVDGDIAKTGCGGKDAHNYATGIMILSLVMCVVSIAFVVCKKKCDCKGVELDVSVYIAGGIVLSTILLSLSISLAKSIDFSKCTTTQNIVWFLVGSSATALMTSLGMAGYRAYSQSIRGGTAPQSSRRSSTLPRDSPTNQSTPQNPVPLTIPYEEPNSQSTVESNAPGPRRQGRPRLSLSPVPFNMPDEEPMIRNDSTSSIPQPRIRNGPAISQSTRSIANPIQPPQLPPWKRYNESPRSEMWQQGARRVHLEKFDDWYNSLNPETRREYLTQSSVPPLWSRYYLQYTLTD
jgi:hypothetical protein